MQIKPPDNVAAHLLFRSLLELPRPRRLLKFRLSNAPKTKLYVRALAAHELPIEEAGNFETKLVISCLTLENGKPAFSSADALSDCLSARELKALSRDCLTALLDIGPIFIYCDYAAWMQKLEEGASHPSNYVVTHALGSSFDMVVLPDKTVIIDHPDQYFGVPKNQLLDCHWFAYWAARKVYKSSIFKEQSAEEILGAVNKGHKP